MCFTKKDSAAENAKKDPSTSVIGRALYESTLDAMRKELWILMQE